jgi:hypothetical protein
MKNRSLHVRIDDALLERVKLYAERHNKTVTQLVLDHFHYLLSVEDVETGMVTALGKSKGMLHGAGAGC